MRKTTLLLGLLFSLALAGSASAWTCIGCTAPCQGPQGPGYACDWYWTGYYGDCQNIDPCDGCIGWIDSMCLGFAGKDLEPKQAEPLLGVKRVTEVIVRHDPAPIRQPAPVQIALAR